MKKMYEENENHEMELDVEASEPINVEGLKVGDQVAPSKHQSGEG